MRRSSIFPITLVSALSVMTGCPSDDAADDEANTDTTGDGDTTTGDGDTDGDTDGSTDATTTTGDTTGDGDTTETTGGDTTTGNNTEACMGDVAPAGALAVGQPFSHWPGAFDLEGNDYDYCVLAGKPILFILSAGWCGPCQDLASGMAGGASSWGAQLDPIRAALEADQLEVVEFLVDNFVDFDATALADLQQWEMMFPNEFVTLIGDPTVGVNGEEPMWQYLGPVHNGGVPAGLLIDADFNVQVMGLQEAVTAAGQVGG